MFLKACLYFLTVINWPNGILPLPALLYLIYNALAKKEAISLDDLIVASLEDLREGYASFLQLTCSDTVKNVQYCHY